MKIKFDPKNPVFSDYRENILVDADHPILAFKANRDRYTTVSNQKSYSGLAQIGSIYSEDALTWNVFRTLEIRCKMQILGEIIGIIKKPIVLVWTLAFSKKASELQALVGQKIRTIDGKYNGQITEPDVIIETDDRIIIVECKLGRKGKRPSHLWESSSDKGPLKRYKDYFSGDYPFSVIDENLYTNEGYQLYRMAFYAYLLGNILGKKPELLSISNKTWWEIPSRKGSARDIWDKFLRDLDVNKLSASNIFWQDIAKVVEKDQQLNDLAEYLNNHICL